ncbi:MAG: hypothetical protein VW878_07225 [Candidatus Poseidoniales archaeon]
MDIATVSLVKPLHHHTHLMLNLDHYDQMEWNATYCEDTLFAYGSEDYLTAPVNVSKSTKTMTSSDSIIATALEQSLLRK